MKAIKIIIVAVIVAALGFGVYKIVHNKPKDPTGSGGIEFPEGCSVDSSYIKSQFGIIKDTEFDELKQRYQQLYDLYSNEYRNEPECLYPIIFTLRKHYLTRFVTMADKEFEGKKWPHYSSIKNMNADLTKELSNNNENLQRIDRICKEYSKVWSHNNLVDTQCGKRPKSVLDKWDINNTQTLINKDRPSASEPVKHTTQYEDTEKSKIKNRLYEGHIAFLDALVDLLEKTIDNNTIKQTWIDSYREPVAKEIEAFEKNSNTLYGKDPSSEKSRLYGRLTTCTQRVEEIEQARTKTN